MASTPKPITLEVCQKVLEVVDQGLVRGMGRPEPGKMCVEAAVCYALGEPHGDQPSCVDAVVRAYKIALNDAAWSSDAARAEGLRAIAVCQLGSKKIEQARFTAELLRRFVNHVLPYALASAGLFDEAAAAAHIHCTINAFKFLETNHDKFANSVAAELVTAIRTAFGFQVSGLVGTAAGALATAAVEAGRLTGNTDKALTLAAEIGVDALQFLGTDGCYYWGQLKDVKPNTPPPQLAKLVWCPIHLGYISKSQ